MLQPHRVQLAPIGDAEEIGAVLARAFQDDPIQRVIYPDGARRAAVLPTVFAGVVRAVVSSGGHVTTIPDCSAAALWCPAGTELSILAMMRGHGRNLPRIVRATPIASIPVLTRIFGAKTRRHRALLPEPHWYLMTLGVDPSHQRRGLGSMLVREGLDRAAADGVAAYLETESEGNVAFYRRLGFRVLEQLSFDRHGIKLWLMGWQPPSSVGAVPTE